MIVLGLDTCLNACSVAVLDVTSGAETVLAHASEDMARGHQERLAPLAQAVMAEAGLPFSRLQRVGATVGPGSFTGLRVGLATARAIAQSLDLRIAPVGTLDALGRGIAEAAPAHDGPVLAVLDARRGQAFAALFDPGGSRRWEPFVAEPEELARRVAELAASALAAGSGALRFRGELEAAGAEVPPDEDSAHRVWARHVCRLAEDGAPSPPDKIQPIYLRPPDAQVWLERDSP